MSEYRRYYQAGASYFFTLVTNQRKPVFSQVENILRLKEAFIHVKKKHPFSLHALVILPDHLHCLWKMPAYDQDFSTRWRLIKRYFSFTQDAELNHRGEKATWQRRFWEHMIRDEEDWKKHMDYIHYNPVKHGLAKKPLDWPYSSLKYWVERGFYEKNWGLRELIINVSEAE